MRPSAPAELTFGIRRGHSLAVVHGTHPSSPVPSAPPSERSSGLPSSPSAPRHEVPGFGAVCSLVRLASWTVPPVLPRVSARQPEPTAGWRDCPRLRSLLAANQWIAESSAVVEPILRGPSPHSLPIESLLVPEAKARPRSSRARKRGVLARLGELDGHSGPRPDHSGRGAWRANEAAGRRVETGVPTGFETRVSTLRGFSRRFHHRSAVMR